MLICVSCFQLFGSRIKSIFCRYAHAQNPHLHYSKLRFLALRKPKTISFYSTSAVLEGYSLRRVLMPNTARAPRINEIPAITSITI